ncbi:MULTISPECIES: hypothetical protein [unclassified Streptomyces]|uniref:hypothetical protein n=1 Tax=unclassified Streptomyces TaxID=2593676 RepID=UPI002E359328|nr:MULTISPECIES: hypothetical protein [unclassified Streptomyces]
MWSLVQLIAPAPLEELLFQGPLLVLWLPAGARPGQGGGLVEQREGLAVGEP